MVLGSYDQSRSKAQGLGLQGFSGFGLLFAGLLLKKT